MIKWLVCYVVGHKPHDYKWEEELHTVRYTECARCARRKTVDGRGWK